MKERSAYVFTADQVAEKLQISKASAYRVIKKLNAELEKKGYTIVNGKISIKYFEEKFYA